MANDSPAMPFKANANCRQRIPRQRHRVTNLPSYEAGLRARGSLIVWFTAKAIEAWGAKPAPAVVDSPANPPWQSPRR